MNLCYCCLLRQPQMDLKTPYIRLGVTEIFSEMLEECFKICLVMEDEDECGICEVCVRRLQDASDFKLQVERCQAELRARLESLHAKNIEPVCQVKSEILDGDEDMAKGDIWIPILDSESEPPAWIQPVSATENQMPCSESDVNIGARSEESSKCESFENQFTLFCHNSDEQTKRKSKKSERRGPYSCEMCPVVSSTKELFIEHKRTHKTKGHSCHICNKIYKQNYKLLDHIRTHKGQKPFRCKVCNKQFTSNSNLWRHNLRHRGIAFICDTCGKKFTQRRDLVAHMKVHSDNMYKCKICGLLFVYKYVLRAHQVVHSEIKHFTCGVCGKQFRRKDHLATHNLIHSGEKPYACGVCDQKFTTKSNVRRHEMKIHGPENQ